jgi:hypothetical protein
MGDRVEHGQLLPAGADKHLGEAPGLLPNRCGTQAPGIDPAVRVRG